MVGQSKRWGPSRALLALAVLAMGPVAGAAAAPTVAGAVADTSWHPSAGAVPASGNYAYVASTSGDYIGGGRTYLYTPADTDFSADVTSTSLQFHIDGYQGWDLEIELPAGQAMTKGGVYTGLTRYPFNGDEGGISFSGEGRGCNDDYGWVTIDDLVVSSGTIQSFLIRFEQRCESTTAPPLHGQIKYDTTAPLPPAPNPVKTVPGGLWAPVAGAIPASGNYFYMASQSGDYVGQGKTWLYLGDRMTVDDSAGDRLSASVPYSSSDDVWWDLSMAGSNRSDQLTAGYYANLMRDPFHNPVVGGFDVSGDGRGCNEETSWVVIDELDMRLAKLSDLTMRYEQHCEGATPALHGKVHWETPVAAGTPGAPTGVTATAIKKGAKVTWVAPASAGTSAITGYQVIDYDRGDAVDSVDLPASARSYSFTDLAVGVPHRFKVRAINGEGPGPRSNVSTNVSPLDPKPAVTGLTPSSGPRTGGTAVQITGHSLTGTTTVTFGATPVPFTVVSDSRIDVTVPALAAGSYDVRVTSPDGTSPVTVADKWTATKLPPGAPTGVVGAPRPAAIDASWTAPASAGDDPINGYTATATKVGSGTPQATISVAAGTTAAALTGLTPGASYTIRVTAQNVDGTGPAGSSATVVVPAPTKGPFSSITNLVKQQWLDFAGRNPTSAESTAGVNAINSGSVTSESFVATMSKRTDWTTYRASVVRLYSAYFNRLPDYGGFNYWVGKLRNGTTLNKASSTFAASSEFKDKYGKLSNRDFVLLIYANVLKRTPDTSGVNYWTKKLDAGMSRGQVMTSFSESSENVRKMQNTVDVVLLYAGMLHSMPSSSVVTAEVAKLVAGTPLSDLAGRILAGAAYAARF
jgi:hypothetical protein